MTVKHVSVFPGKWFTVIIFLPFLLFMPTSYLRAEGQSSVLGPSQIESEVEPLACDEEMKHHPSNINDSYLSKLWELDEHKPRDRYVIMAHRSNYILPVAYNSSPNAASFQEASTGEDIQETEAKFQISLKIKLRQDILGKDMDLWFGYTQQSFWQVYNLADSSPFRETNYEPELLLNVRTHFHLLGMNARAIHVGFNHQSNGRSEPFSRSWNRIVGTLSLEKDNFILLFKAWYRIPEGAEKDDNPDIDEYMGYGEIWSYYLRNGCRLGAMLRNNLKSSDNRGAFHLEWSIPITKKVGVYIQYFNGYGESLLDYNHGVNRIAIGFILTDWI
jgi:phospholipase A1